MGSINRRNFVKALGVTSLYGLSEASGVSPVGSSLAANKNNDSLIVCSDIDNDEITATRICNGKIAVNHRPLREGYGSFMPCKYIFVYKDKIGSINTVTLANAQKWFHMWKKLNNTDPSFCDLYVTQHKHRFHDHPRNSYGTYKLVYKFASLFQHIKFDHNYEWLFEPFLSDEISGE